MSRTKVIYFLSAFVLIIGCFALNKSYSLFVDTKEEQVLSSTVPVLNGDLSLASVTVEGTEEGATAPSTVLVKQIVTNTGNATMNYAINAHSASTYSLRSVPTYEVSAATDGTDTYYSTGTLPAGESVDLYFAIENTSTDPVALNFSIEKNYETISEELETNINNDEPYMVSAGGLPYNDKPNSLAYHVINNFVNSDLYNGTAGSGGDIPSMFGEGVDSVTLGSGETVLDVPSPTEFTDIETKEVGLYKTEDDYGTSYYFRGASSVNYVNFAGFIWRIVRINGDGSVRLILDNTLDAVTKDGVAVYTNSALSSIDSDGIVPFNSVTNDNGYVGYMFGDFSETSSSYDEAHQNIKDSTIKTYIDKFYEEYIIDYENYLADTLFCGDKRVGTTVISGYEGKGFGGGIGSTYKTIYATHDRIPSSGSAMPSLECAKDATNTYSRYTSKLELDTKTLKTVNINNDLKYPIALLSADEAVFAGSFIQNTNRSCYLFLFNDVLNKNIWWLMSPFSYSSGNSNMYTAQYVGMGGFAANKSSTRVRPVININLDAIVSGGDGTKDTSVGEGPYTLTLNS